jgi:hypothetical protein
MELNIALISVKNDTIFETFDQSGSTFLPLRRLEN